MTAPRLPELRRVFLIAVQRANLSPDAILTAWTAAMRHPAQAFRCYLAIARSL